MFRLLVNHVSGIGPKLALAVLSGMSVNNFKSGSGEFRCRVISKISGVGKKTAERMVLELKDKVGVAAAWEAASAAHAPTPEQEQANEAVLALIALGYKQVDAHKTVRDLQEREGAGKSAEELVKLALKKMAAGRRCTDLARRLMCDFSLEAALNVHLANDFDSSEDKLDAIRDAFQAKVCSRKKIGCISPDAFPIREKFASELEQLGHRLFVFQRACNQLYQLSVGESSRRGSRNISTPGNRPSWLSCRGRKIFRDELPRVIRPDLILTEDGYTIAEIDSVPGGIGLTGWLNQTYSALGEDVIGGEDGMLDGFQKRPAEWRRYCRFGRVGDLSAGDGVVGSAIESTSNIQSSNVQRRSGASSRGEL